MTTLTNSVNINIADKLSNSSALTREQGQIIYDIIFPLLEKNNEVTLDFSGIESIITPFLNVAIGKLYENYSSSQLQRLLHVENVPSGMNSKFSLVIENAKNFYSNSKAFIEAKKEVLQDNEE